MTDMTYEHESVPHRGAYPGPPAKRIVVSYGFWIFLLSDFVMFSAFFSKY